MKSSKLIALFILLLGLGFMDQTVAQSKYDNLRDPFSRPPRPTDNKPSGPPNIGRSPDWEGGTPKESKSASPAPSASPALEENKWFEFANQAWRPTIVFVAGEVKGVAVENLTNGFLDILRSYFVGPAWATQSAKWLAPKVVSRLFTIYSIAEPSEIGANSELSYYSDLGPDSEKLNAYLKKIHEQREKEKTEQKIDKSDLPQYFRNPGSVDSGPNVSTEEARRHAIFADQNLTKDGALDVIANAATQIYGGGIGRFTKDWLWLYDGDRIKSQGLSKAALDLFDEGDTIIEGFRGIVLARHVANACLIQPPQWVGSPRIWACSLPIVKSPANSCFCPIPANPAAIITGTPKRYQRGMICEVPEQGVCPMVRSEPQGTLCTCTGYGMAIGQVR